jgi:hypothetical protein
VTAYCRVMNVSKDNYYQWLKRLRKQHPEWQDLLNHTELIKSNTATGRFVEAKGSEPTNAKEAGPNLRPECVRTIDVEEVKTFCS